LNDGVKLEGGCNEDERDVENFGGEAAAVSELKVRGDDSYP